MLLAMLSSCMAAWQSYLFQHFVHSKIHVSKFGSFHYLEIATFDQKFLGRLGAGLSSISLTPNLEDCASSCPLVSSPADWFNTAVVPLVPSTELSSLIFRSRCCIMRILCESLDMDCDDSVGIADNEVLRAQETTCAVGGDSVVQYFPSGAAPVPIHCGRYHQTGQQKERQSSTRPLERHQECHIYCYCWWIGFPFSRICRVDSNYEYCYPSETSAWDQAD